MSLQLKKKFFIGVYIPSFSLCSGPLILSSISFTFSVLALFSNVSLLQGRNAARWAYKEDLLPTVICRDAISTLEDHRNKDFNGDMSQDGIFHPP